MNHLVIIVIATVAFFGRGADAQCYNCTYTVMGEMMVGQRGCMEPGFDSTGIETVPCENKCKISQVEIAAGEGTPQITVYMRGCQNRAVEGPCIDIYAMEVVEGQTVTQTCCEGALCNGMEAAGQTTTQTSCEGALCTGMKATGQITTQTSCEGALCNNAALIQLSIALTLAPLCALVF